MRDELVASLREMLRAHGRPLLQHEASTKLMLDRAVTKKKRQDMLALFFRSVFTEVVTLELLYFRSCCYFARHYLSPAISFSVVVLFATENDRYILRRVFSPNTLSPPFLHRVSRNFSKRRRFVGNRKR